MDKTESLRAGIAEMRSVANRLIQWAHDLEQTVSDDLQVVSSTETSELPGGESRRLRLRNNDLESSFQDPEAPKNEMDAGKPGSAAGHKKAEPGRQKGQAAKTEPAAAEEKKAQFTLPEVRAILAEKCAAGFGAQVKALIESYGASSLKGVPAEKYGDLLEAVGHLGGDADAG